MTHSSRQVLKVWLIIAGSYLVLGLIVALYLVLTAEVKNLREFVAGILLWPVMIYGIVLLRSGASGF